MMNPFLQWVNQKATWKDGLGLCLFTVLICWHPFYLHQELNFLELSLYLPSIGAVLDGQVPYRDFFYLRGPFELYLPALLMKIFGTHVAVLSTYFYVGTVLTLLAGVMIAACIYPSRLWLYVMVPVLVARTFPRVVFTYWGGMRYAAGMLAVLMIVLFFRQQQKRWLVAAAVCTVFGGFISIEIGVCSLLAIGVALCLDSKAWQSLKLYALTVFGLSAAYLLYLFFQGALTAYAHDQWMVVIQMTKTFVQTEPVPSNLKEILHAAVVPSDKNFRQMTPLYCYGAFLIYMFWRIRRGACHWADRAATAVMVYSFMIFVTGFRNLWANVFEMALLPEKIIFFYLWARILSPPNTLVRGLEFVQSLDSSRREPTRPTEACLPAGRHSEMTKILKCLVIAVTIGLIVSSLIFSIARFNKRFLFFRKDPLKGQLTEEVNLSRLKHMVVPQWQAQDMIQLKEFIDENVSTGQSIWMYPELGLAHFVLDRPWVGRYSMPTLAWIDEKEYVQYMQDLEHAQPHYAIVNKRAPEYFQTSYFLVAANQEKYEEQMLFLNTHYKKVGETPTYNIYTLR